MYPDYDHDIPPASELTLAKLGDGGIVSTDTCNATQKVNGMLIKKFKFEFGLYMRNQTIGDIIVGAVENTVTRSIQDDEDENLEALAAQHSNNTPEDGNVSPNSTVISGYFTLKMKELDQLMTCYFSENMKGQLKEIDPKWRILPNMQGICQAVDKHFDPCGKYAKGEGKGFCHHCRYLQ